MGLEVQKISAADQERQLRDQLFDALLKQDALERELVDVRKNVLGLTNIIGGINLGKEIASAAVQAAIEAKKNQAGAE